MGPPLYSSRMTGISPTPTLVEPERSPVPPVRREEIRSILEERTEDTPLWTAITYFYDHYNSETFEDILAPHDLVDELLSVHLDLIRDCITYDRLILQAETFAEVLESADGQIEALARCMLTDLQRGRRHLDSTLEILEFALEDAGLVPTFRGLFPGIFAEDPPPSPQPVTTSPVAFQQSRPGQPRPLARTTHSRSPTPFERRVRPRRNSDLENIPPTPPMAGSPTGQNPHARGIASPLSTPDHTSEEETHMGDSPPPLPIPPPGAYPGPYRSPLTGRIHVPVPTAQSNRASSSATVQCGFCLGNGHDYVTCPHWICPGCGLHAPGHTPDSCPDPRRPRTWDAWAALYQHDDLGPTPPPTGDAPSILQWPDSQAARHATRTEDFDLEG